MSLNFATGAEDIVKKKSLFKKQVELTIEKELVWSKVATILKTTAKVIESPYTTFTGVKAHKLTGQVPIGQAEVKAETLTLDRYIGGALTYDDPKLNWINFDVKKANRADLLGAIQEKENKVATADFVGDATAMAGPKDLSTAEKVRKFVVGVSTKHKRRISIQDEIDNAKSKKCELHGKPFIACGEEAFTQLTSVFSGMVLQSSMKGLDTGVVETPYGVTIINLGEAADNPKRIFVGTGGIPVVAYRGDKLEVDMGTLTTEVAAAAVSLEVAAGDKMLKRQNYIMAQTEGMNAIFDQTKHLVEAGLMA